MNKNFTHLIARFFRGENRGSEDSDGSGYVRVDDHPPKGFFLIHSG